MNQINIKKDVMPSMNELVNLYNNVGWNNYTNDVHNLKSAIDNSKLVITAWEENNLVGLLRAVGDGCTIMYIQDILVKQEYQRQGIGKKLMDSFMADNGHIRQKVLLTDNTANTIEFYQSCGFKKASDYNGVAFVQYTFN